MKLYTEEQVRETYLFGKFSEFSFDEVLKLFAPIQLPSDEEMKGYALEFGKTELQINSFEEGAKWMRDQITLTPQT
jgi:hypothetical protein